MRRILQAIGKRLVGFLHWIDNEILVKRRWLAFLLPIIAPLGFWLSLPFWKVLIRNFPGMVANLSLALQSAQSNILIFARNNPIIWPALLFLLGFLVIYFVPRLQLKRVHIPDPEKYLKVEDELRKSWAQILGGAALLTGLYFTWDTAQVGRDGQITDRFIRAVEQLGSEKLDVRLGAIYSLERIAKDSRRDYTPIMEVLTSYVRQRSPAKNVSASPERLLNKVKTEETSFLPEDIKAVVAVLRRREISFETDPIELRGADLRGADFSETSLKDADLKDANLEGADLFKADLTYVNLIDANLRLAFLQEATLTDAALYGVKLRDASVLRADLRGSILEGADLRNTFFYEADFRGADLTKTDLRGAILGEANLEGSILNKANLEGAILWSKELPNSGAIWVDGSKVTGGNAQTSLWKLSNGKTLDLSKPLP